jgi:mono/diheme cytochrome c family protein
MIKNVPSVMIVLLAILASSGLAEQSTVTNEVREGKRLALLICGKCHVVARDQLDEPILDPPAPSFESMAQRDTMTPASIRTFLTTTHRDISNPKGMPNPQLLEYQIEPVMAYLLSLQKHP